MATHRFGPDHPKWKMAEEAWRRANEGEIQTQIAKDLGEPRSTVRRWIRQFKEHRLNTSDHVHSAMTAYDLDAPERTPEQAWNSGKEACSRVLSEAIRKQDYTIKRKEAFCIFHTTDDHIDDDSTPLELIEADFKRARDLGAVMCHGGDVINNWPSAGRLAQKWKDQECTLPAALLRIQHYIELLDPDFWCFGNHEDMNPLVKDLIRGWLPRKTKVDDWLIRFTVKTPGGRDCRAVLSHKFQKGMSWFHKSHGHIREVLEGQPADVYMDGHLHSDGVMDYTLPERQMDCTFVSSAGYKLTDDFAKRISRGGVIPKIRGRCHYLICDPKAAYDEDFVKAFKSPDQAEIYLNGLQNLRAA